MAMMFVSLSRRKRQMPSVGIPLFDLRLFEPLSGCVLI